MPRLILILCLFSFTQAFAQYTVETIPNRRLVDGSHVSNPDAILSEEAVATLDTLLFDIERKTTAQVAVVAVNSIGDADLFDFAQQLFNTWGIGHTNNNGMLVLLVTDLREIRFHTGGGVQGILTDVTCKRIQRDYMVPEFKEGNYEAGMIAGMQRVHELLTDPDKAAELEYAEVDDPASYMDWVLFLLFFYGVPLVCVFWYRSANKMFGDSVPTSRDQYREMRITRTAWLIMFGLIPLIIVLLFSPGPVDQAISWCFITLYLYHMMTLLYRLRRERQLLKKLVVEGKYYEAGQFISSTAWFWFFMMLIFPLPFIFYFIFHLTRRSHYRNHPRSCNLCSSPMKKVSEREDDQFLDERQRLEEKIKAVNYDVWLCTSCKATREWNYIRNNSDYTPCPKCRTRAYYSKSRRTVTSATYSRSGEGEEVFECKFCHETSTKTYSIAQLVASTSSSSSSSSFSSSSSGSSWGGGRSDGGGASSKW